VVGEWDLTVPQNGLSRLMIQKVIRAIKSVIRMIQKVTLRTAGGENCGYHPPGARLREWGGERLLIELEKEKSDFIDHQAMQGMTCGTNGCRVLLWNM